MMMPGPRPPFRGGMPPQSFINPMQGRPPMGSMMKGAQGMSRGGGLLSKLLGKGSSNPAAGIGAAKAAGSSRASGGILQAISNPSSINGILTNTQKVLNTAQQIGPMVQQYGPLVRNLPSMWKLYKGLKDAPEQESASADTGEKPEENTEEKASVKKSSKKKTSVQQTKSVESHPAEKKSSKTSGNGESRPKLYI